ncbi:Sec-independent protein translocase protein TATB, chloroplastic [Dendrobium catenatum]|uniref:Sec-independent protein translocase protein TATB, chloroplastic n=1 Tax=Dendrobium catenatum TaxID=906689 RepID=A0A2I0W9A1_9ASPA|nr:Sec-independent protein translocase protein TATB, chloroplastic [Dendrobium catenatum]
MVVYASLFGVGAPEVLVIGVVALLVFGPKGLVEVARNLEKKKKLCELSSQLSESFRFVKLISRFLDQADKKFCQLL